MELATEVVQWAAILWLLYLARSHSGLIQKAVDEIDKHV